MISSRLVKLSKQPRNEPPGDRSRMLIVGERLMRAGSEGNLLRSTPSNPHQEHQEHGMKMISNPVTARGERRPCSAGDVDDLDRKLSSRDTCDRTNPRSPRTLPRKQTLAMQGQNTERRREAFLELLKQKYPHHAAAIAGHQERLRDHIRTHSVLREQECVTAVMTEGEALKSFTRGSRTRASLPVVRSSNHTKERSLGVLHLQYGEETKQILMPNEVSSADTVHALFVSAFPQQLSLSMLESPNMAIYMKDHARNVYYELTDVRSISPNSHLKVYHKDPNQAFNPSSRPNNGDTRMTRERIFSTRQQPAAGPPMAHALPPPQSPVQGSLSPPSARSVPSSPSRFTYNSRTLPSGGTLPRERVSGTPCSSAILERRDVKPDEDVDPYGFPETRLSMTDSPDGATFHHHSLYRQKSRKYSDSTLSPKGQKTPPTSPHRVSEVRMMDVHPGQNTHMMLERTSSLRRSLRKESNGTARANVTSPVYADLHGGGPFQGPAPSADPQSKRMKAMEQQLASLAGLVQHALFKGTKDSGSEKTISESGAHDANGGGGVSPMAEYKSPTFQSEPLASPSAGDASLGLLLSAFRRNVSSLRQQLHQIRQTQLQNQVVVRSMLKQAEEELTLRMTEKLQTLDEPLKKQRTEVEQERRRYELLEESVLLQLGDLETHVEQLKRNSGSAQRPVTLRDVEDGAVSLRKVGETLATLKGEFPALQSRMHAVLRTEVEAVRFLKEEPQKMDNMLKRVRALTETLSSLRIRATEGSLLTDPISTKPESPDSLSPTRDSAVPLQRLSSNPAHFTFTSSTNSAHCELVSISSSSPIMAQKSCSSPLIPGHGRDAPAVGAVTASDVQRVQDEAPNRSEVVERRQVEDEADTERVLQQAQANLMKNIPDLGLTNQETNHSRREEMDTPSSPCPEATSPAEPVADKPVQTGSECVPKPPLVKPHRSSVDRATANQDAASKSPPPTPPRKPPVIATGVTTGRSGEVIFTARKDPTPAQEEAEVLQSKPQRVRPELKPKPHTLPPIHAREKQEEERDEDKIVAELQVFEKCPVKDLEPRYVVDLTTHVLPDRELESTFSLSTFDPKVIYYITGTAKTPSDNPRGGPEVQNQPEEGGGSSPKVEHPNTPDFTPQPNVLTPTDVTVDSPKSVKGSLKGSADTRTDGSGDGDEAKAPEAPESITTKPERGTSVSSDAPEKATGVQTANSLVHSEDTGNQEDMVFMNSSKGRSGYTEDTSLSPDLPAEEPQPSPDNIAFMITKTKVQALSTGEYQQLVSSKEQDVETVKVGTDESMSAPEDGEFSKKSVIIVFDEPMDIRQAYKRLSTIFECEEELDRTLSKERIIEDFEELNEDEVTRDGVGHQVSSKSESRSSGNHLQVPGQQQKVIERSSAVSDEVSHEDQPGDGKQEAKKKFKFKFPKKQLAAIGQALRTGTKTGKKTLQVVVYEDEEEADGTLKEAREAKRFEIKSSLDTSGAEVSAGEPSESQTVTQQTSGRTNEICQTAYKTLDSLEETIKQLETTITNMDPALAPDTSCKDPKVRGTAEDQAAQVESSPLKKPAPLGPKPVKPPQRKKSKVQCVPRPPSSSSVKQNPSGSSSTARVAPPRTRPQAGSVEKPPKPAKLQDSQSQFRQRKSAKTPSDNPRGGPEVQNQPKEGGGSSPKVEHPNTPNFTPQPNVLTPTDVTVDSPKSVKGSLKGSADTRTDGSGDGDEAKAPEAPESITTKPKRGTSVSSDAPEKATGVQTANSLVHSEDTGNQEDMVFMNSSKGRSGYTEDTSLSPDLPAEEPQPSPDNIAFMITKTKVQALSTGEYQQLVSSKEQDVETVKVGTDESMSAPEDGEFSKKSVIIVFDEPMDIRQAYKRLSTIFECEEELDRTLSKERIIEDFEELNEDEVTRDGVGHQVSSKSESRSSGNHLQVPGQQQKVIERSSAVSDEVSHEDQPGDGKQEAKKKFKFKFPKKQLAAIGQALRTGTKTGKKTLQVVVYEDEEEADGTLKEAREAKRFEIKSSLDTSGAEVSAGEPSESQTVTQQTSGRTNEICQTAYKTLDSLEETIKQLETTITNMDPALAPDTSCKDPKVRGTAEDQAAQVESSPLKKPAPLGPKPVKPPQRKKSKVQCVPRPPSSSSVKQNPSGSSSTARVAPPRTRPQAGSVEKPPKPAKLQDSQSQFRQVVLL